MTELGVECHFPSLLTPQLCDSVPCSYFSFGVITRVLLFDRTRVRSLAMLVTNSLTHSLTNSCLVNLFDVTLACEDATQNLLRLLLMLMMRIVLATVCWKLRFGHKAKLLFRL